MKTNLLLQLLADGFIHGAIFSLLAIGFGIIYRSLRFFDLSFGALYTISSYMMLVFFSSLGFNVFLAFFFSVICTVLVATGFEKGIYLRFYRRSAGAGVLLVASLGIYIFVENTISLFFGNRIQVLSSAIEPTVNLGGITLARIQLIQLVIGIALATIFFILVKKNKYIKALWALGDEPELLQVLGLPFENLRVLSFLIAAIFISTASILTSFDVGMTPHKGLGALLTAAVAVIIGGVDSIAGWILGAYMLAFLQSIVIFQFSFQWTPLVTFGLLIIVMLTKPEGILGLKKRLEE